MRMEYIVMLTAISNKKLTKLVATRPSQEDFPIFPYPLPIPPFPPFPSVPPEKVLFLLSYFEKIAHMSVV